MNLKLAEKLVGELVAFAYDGERDSQAVIAGVQMWCCLVQTLLDAEIDHQKQRAESEERLNEILLQNKPL